MNLVNTKKFICVIIPILNSVGILFSQNNNIAFYKSRFDKYLNLHHQLDKTVIFETDKIIIKNQALNKEIIIYEDEIPALSAMLESEKLNELEIFFLSKAKKHLSKKESDSILISIDEKFSVTKKNHLPLSGIRIAIDPGHFANDLSTAQIEDRLLYFKHIHNNKTDTITLIEAQLTYKTAKILAEQLKEQGAEVLMTRPNPNATAFGTSYNDWFNKRKNTVLDSLYISDQLSKEKYLKLKSCNKKLFFNLFFKEYELQERARIINQFNPHLTIIIHYNVDEKNSPWNKATLNNYSMCFIGGAFEEKDLDKPVNLIHFLRLLLTNQIEKSKKISALTMKNFEQQLSVSAAKKEDARYLQNVCIPSENEGVYCRNLLLTRYIISPLVYGESMCQDNIFECKALSQNDFNYKGDMIPRRIYEVANAYFDAIMKYFIE